MSLDAFQQDLRYAVRRLLEAPALTAVTVAMLAVAIALLAQTVALGFSGNPATRVYLIGDWPAPFGIVLVADWLSSLMLVLTGIVGLFAMI